MIASQGQGTNRLALAWRRLSVFWRVLPALAGLWIVVACGGPSTKSATPAPTVTPSATTTPGNKGTPPVPKTPVPTTAGITLTIWGPDSMAPLDDTPGGAALAGQLAAFTTSHPGVNVQYVRKKAYGVGGLTQYLRSAQAVAPSQLPDLVLFDMREIGLLAEGNLLQPLESTLGNDLLADLWPYARQAGEVGNHLLAVQYDCDVQFLAYNADLVPTPPATWAELLAGGQSYLLPIGGTDGAVQDTFLPQYLAAGGKLTDREGHAALDQTVLAAILDVYRSAREAKILPDSGLELEGDGDCWPVYLTTGVAMTNVSSWDYARDRSRLARTRVAPLPTLSGGGITISRGFGWGIVTRDAGRAAAAGALLKQLLQPEPMAAWSKASNHLPSRRAALPLTVADQDYLAFLQGLLEKALPQPREPLLSQATEALRGPIEGVIRGNLSPLAAASEAADRMRAAPQATITGSQ